MSNDGFWDFFGNQNQQLWTVRNVTVSSGTGKISEFAFSRTLRVSGLPRSRFLKIQFFPGQLIVGHLKHQTNRTTTGGRISQVQKSKPKLRTSRPTSPVLTSIPTSPFRTTKDPIPLRRCPIRFPGNSGITGSPEICRSTLSARSARSPAGTDPESSTSDVAGANGKQLFLRLSEIGFWETTISSCFVSDRTSFTLSRILKFKFRCNKVLKDWISQFLVNWFNTLV